MITITKIFKTYIKGTPEKVVVNNLTLNFCNLTKTVAKNCGFTSHRVYITTRVLKHLYDSKPAEEFESIMKYLYPLVCFPNYIYENKGGKRGSFGFVKDFQGIKYFCSIERTEDCNPDDGGNSTNYVVTAFRLRKGKEKYLKNYKLLWSWKGDIPSS